MEGLEAVRFFPFEEGPLLAMLCGIGIVGEEKPVVEDDYSAFPNGSLHEAKRLTRRRIKVAIDVYDGSPRWDTLAR